MENGNMVFTFEKVGRFRLDNGRLTMQRQYAKANPMGRMLRALELHDYRHSLPREVVDGMAREMRVSPDRVKVHSEKTYSIKGDVL